MKCIICGKELKGMQRKYCSMKCAQKGYYTGKAKSMINTENQVKELFECFRKAFDFNLNRFIPSEAWKGRVFVSSCYMLGHTPCSIARGINKNHASILYHHKKATSYEKMLAEEFLKNPKTYKYVEKSNKIYPEGFHY